MKIFYYYECANCGDVPEVVDDAIMKKKMKVVSQKSIQRTEDLVKKYEHRGFRFDGYRWNVN